MASAASAPSAYVSDELRRRAGATTVAVIGAGFLGRCIALDLSLLGVQVLLFDSNPQAAASLATAAYELLNPMLHLGYVSKSMLTRACSNVRFVSQLSACASASLVIDAIPDDLQAKTALFQSLERLVPVATVLATSTIELDVSALQASLQHPERFLGVRFFHPCVLLPPVEITVGSQTSQCTVEAVVSLLRQLHKQPHRGPTRRVLSNREVSALQFNTAIDGQFYHGLLEPKAVAVHGLITPADGPPLVDSHSGLRGSTTTL
ncbi:hypothetical protein P43SY_005217 [Pythium insidiosum]|uniref:3-hydroxyacyl-CoA dehydrogenase NAD binding domain-containing protein n=1 Tax=Pythium insidiosum TaxID=114742 RepID=A0AAD5QDN7_PYTIN|nr:hypothetical protein P43SY_005217 [Pythium insidiosum]KAJ0411235.1 hypothetical protein ATCC90586_003874 [Pythium insidiosum]